MNFTFIKRLVPAAAFSIFAMTANATPPVAAYRTPNQLVQ
jgi:hypothetical protein